MATGGAHDDRGTGLVATMVLVPLVLLLAAGATQILLRLHTTAAATALADNAARDIATAVGAPAITATQVTEGLRADLEGAGGDVKVDWHRDRDRIQVHVRIPAPRLLAGPWSAAFDQPIDVAGSARIERWR